MLRILVDGEELDWDPDEFNDELLDGTVRALQEEQVGSEEAVARAASHTYA